MTAQLSGEEEKAQLLLGGDPLQDDTTLKSSERTDAPSGAGRPRNLAAWVVSASISLSSTRYILITRNFHYPMILLAWQLMATFILICLHLLVRKTSLGREGSAGSSAHGFPFNLRSIGSLILATVALPVTYQAILHFPNVASLALFSVHAIAASELFRLVGLNIPDQLRLGLHPPPKDVQRVLILATTAFVSTYIMFATDYRRTSRGDRSMLVSSYLTAFAQTILAFSSRRQRENKLALDLFHLILTGGALLLALIWYFPFEGPYTTLQTPEWWLLSLNLLASAFAFSTGGSLIVPLCEPLDLTSEDHTRFSHSLPQRLASCFSFAGAVALASLLLPDRGFINALQVISYAVTLTALFFGCSHSRRSSVSTVFRLNGVSKTVTLITLLCWFAYVPLNFTDYPFGNTLPVKHATIDHNYLTERRFDIVVARFDEDPMEIVRLVTRITDVPTIKTLNSRLFVYSKNSDTEVPKLRTALEKGFAADMRNKGKWWVMNVGIARKRPFPRIEVIALENYGRESGTYLSHIARFFGGLAQHTLFTQAIVHDLDDTIARLDYFVPGPSIAASPGVTGTNAWWGKLGSLRTSQKSDPDAPHKVESRLSTGMLPLGFTTEVCDCHRCSDKWGWHDTSPLVPAIFTAATGLRPKQCDKLLLTYKGQFIVSAQRIHGLDRNEYVELRDGLIHDDRWEHSKEYLEKYTGHGGVNAAEEGSLVAGGNSQRWGEKDSLERPWFGYTIERMWGVLMQCSDMGIAWKCPTLKSRWRGVFAGDKGDCQCWDHVTPPSND